VKKSFGKEEAIPIPKKQAEIQQAQIINNKARTKPAITHLALMERLAADPSKLVGQSICGILGITTV
jgi:hypothetical protein